MNKEVRAGGQKPIRPERTGKLSIWKSLKSEETIVYRCFAYKKKTMVTREDLRRLSQSRLQA